MNRPRPKGWLARSGTSPATGPADPRRGIRPTIGRIDAASVTGAGEAFLVDFTKRVGDKPVAKASDSVELYAMLDRARDKGFLRPVQNSVLTEWFRDRQGSQDVIVKLHTGRDKTLIGLLMLRLTHNPTLVARKAGPTTRAFIVQLEMAMLMA